MVYEAHQHGGGYSIGYATATNPLGPFGNRKKILSPSATGWDHTDVGTPSLYKENGTWYLYYHGTVYDAVSPYTPTQVQIGVATGTDLTNLTKHPNNPIVPTVPGTWESGTTGARDIIKYNGLYYMVYEGSTSAPYLTANWSFGMASSKDLINWTKFKDNPIHTPSATEPGRTTAGSMGYDGVYWLHIGTDNYVYYRLPSSIEVRQKVDLSQFSWKYETENSGYHEFGYNDGAGRWCSNSGLGYLNYGPYTRVIPGDESFAHFKINSDVGGQNNSSTLFEINVNDASASNLLASKDVTPPEFAGNSDTFFSLAFLNQSPGNALEFRTYRNSYSAAPNFRLCQDFVTVQKGFYENFEAEDGTAYHNIGRKSVDGMAWEASVATDAAGYMLYGPYRAGVPKGKSIAYFKLLIDNNTADNAAVADIDVSEWDGTTSTQLAKTTIYRNQFTSAWAYQLFALPFTRSTNTKQLELRIYWRKTAYIKADKVLLTR
jgi:hypothetical protein